MQTIIYTPPNNLENEIEIISQLLDNGADYLYIYKPELDDFSLVDFVESIPERYWKQCISTSLIITKEFDLGGYHFTRDIVQKNELYNEKILNWLSETNKISSVTAHNMQLTLSMLSYHPFFRVFPKKIIVMIGILKN